MTRPWTVIMLGKVSIRKVLKMIIFLPNHNVLPLISGEILIFITRNKYENNPHFPHYTNIQKLTINTTALNNYSKLCLTFSNAYFNDIYKLSSVLLQPFL